MYYNLLAEQELGFDAFISPDYFNRTAQPVDIYEVFKREYALNSQARYIYYYSDGNYPLTLTPTASEYYRYGYTTGGTEVIADVPLNGTAVTIFGETTSTKRWVAVYRPSTANFSLSLDIVRAEWYYCSNLIYKFSTTLASGTVIYVKYIHMANINSITDMSNTLFYNLLGTSSTGRITVPETISVIAGWYIFQCNLITKISFPNTKNVAIIHDTTWASLRDVTKRLEINFGASTSIPVFNSAEQTQYSNLAILSVSPQNTGYSSFDNCDIIYNKALTTLVWLAPKTTRGLTLPDQLPQAQITALGTKLSANIMQGYPLYIGTQITDLTNLYLSNKSFTTVTVGSGNTAFSVENGMLRTATNLIKAGTSNTGDLIIPNVTTIEATCFLRCTGYTGNLTIPNTVTSIAAGVFSGLKNLTSLTLPVGFDTNVYNQFWFANFTAASLNTAILNLANGTVGTPKYFLISKTSFDALNVAYPNAVSDAAARYINVKSSIVQDSSLKLWLDAGNTPSYPGSGTTWNDLSGNDNNGTLVNGVAYSTANGGVMSFDGVNGYVDCGNSTSVQITGSITLSAFVKANSVSGRGNILAKNGNSGYRCRIDSASNPWWYVSGNTISGSAINLNQWYNVVFIGNSSGLKIYVNNTLVASNSIPYNPSSAVAGNLYIGCFGPGSEVFNGLINDTLIYNRALTPAEIAHNFNVTRNKYGI